MPDSAFHTTLGESLEAQHFIKLVLSKPKNKSSELRRIIVKPVLIKEKKHLSFVFKNPTKDITKNYLLEAALKEIKKQLDEDFWIANLFTSQADWVLMQNKNGKHHLKKSQATSNETPEMNHDHQKNHASLNQKYLKALGILNPSGKIAKHAGDKYKQIVKFIEIIDKLIQQSPTLKDQKKISIADMGSGKGYLTFALYDHLKNNCKRDVTITGIELRKELVSFCNGLAKELNFDNLLFKQGYINAKSKEKFDILIALHACDTATDDAIFQGLQSKAQLIVCAPCCHKQVRKSMHVEGPLKEITKHGILKERQAELATDAIRAMILEAEAYNTKVFEFISNEHTGKNLMIAGIKVDRVKKDYKEYISEVKKEMGIRSHYLENLLDQKT